MDSKELYKLYEQHPVITTDSRNCPKGSIFIALKGASFDGNKFAKAALEKGCSYAIVDEKEYAEAGNEHIIFVDDALVAYKEIAREHRRTFQIPVIGITGTNGKTTSKELISAVLAEKHNCLLFLNESNTDLTEMAEQRNFERIVSYGQDETANIQGEIVDCAPFLRFRWHEAGGEWKEVLTHLVGAYNLDNMLAAIAIGLHFGVSTQQICHALENYVPSNNRSQLTETQNNKLIVDAYNANPSSMAAAIENFRLMAVKNKMAILGDMRELGDVTAEEHQKIVDLLLAAGITNVWLVGDEFGKTKTTFQKFKDVEEVKAELAHNMPKNHYILIKGSNGTKLYELPKLL